MAIQAVGVLVLALAAHRIGILDGRGSALAAGFGLFILYGVGASWLALLAIFTGLGFAVTRVGYEKKRTRAVNEPHGGRRGWRNVVANGVTATAIGTAGLFASDERLALAYVVAISVAAADTFASELGSLAPKAYLITHLGREVPPGTNGGVSWPGTWAAVLGSVTVALAGHVLTPLAWHLVPWVVVAGVAGSLIDSVLGATWERSPQWPERPLSKGDVNFISITVPSGALLLVGLLGWV